MIDGITGKYTRAPTLYRIALMTRPLNFSKWLTRSLPQRAAVDRHLAHLDLYPRSDSAGLAPVAPPPPTDGCCGPLHTLLSSRTVLCCGPCSLTVHFRGPRPCSSAPPSDGCCGPHHTLFRPRTVLCRGPRSRTVLCCTVAPGSGHLGGFHRPHCVAAVANANPYHGQSRDLCHPCSTAAPGSGHLAFSRPPAPPVALGVTNGRTTPRSYAKLTKTLISMLKTSAFKTKTLISTPKTTISTPESIMPTSYIYSREAFVKFDFRVFIV